MQCNASFFDKVYHRSKGTQLLGLRFLWQFVYLFDLAIQTAFQTWKFQIESLIPGAPRAVVSSSPSCDRHYHPYSVITSRKINFPMSSLAQLKSVVN